VELPGQITLPWQAHSAQATTMRLTKYDFLVAACILFGAVVFGQSPVDQENAASRGVPTDTSFAPLEKWTAAVLAENKESLRAMYAKAPSDIAQTLQWKSRDPTEEVDFWSTLPSLGVTELEAKILEVDSLRPDVRQLTLRIELTLTSKSGLSHLVVSAVQVWLRQGHSWYIIASKRGDLAPRVVRQLPEPRLPNPHLYPPPEDAATELSNALTRAAQDHKRVLLVFGGNWCYDCHVLDTAFHSKEIAPLLDANYHVVHINVGEFDHNLDLAKRFGIPLEKGVPSLAVLDSDGKLVTSQKNGEFESSVKIGLADVVAFLERWKPLSEN
jgi:thioredoxin 1